MQHINYLLFHPKRKLIISILQFLFVMMIAHSTLLTAILKVKSDCSFIQFEFHLNHRLRELEHFNSPMNRMYNMNEPQKKNKYWKRALDSKYARAWERIASRKNYYVSSANIHVNNKYLLLLRLIRNKLQFSVVVFSFNFRFLIIWWWKNPPSCYNLFVFTLQSLYDVYWVLSFGFWELKFHKIRLLWFVLICNDEITDCHCL